MGDWDRRNTRGKSQSHVAVSRAHQEMGTEISSDNLLEYSKQHVNGK